MTETLSPAFTLESAIEIATKAHDGQFDRAGEPYIKHPLNVMGQLKGETERMVAALHDVIEDTTLTYDYLREKGCPEDVIDAIKLVTRPDDMKDTDETYLAWVQDIANSGNQTAINVKWGDLNHNSDLKRISNPKDKDFKRMRKYAKAKEILRPVISPYLLV